MPGADVVYNDDVANAQHALGQMDVQSFGVMAQHEIQDYGAQEPTQEDRALEGAFQQIGPELSPSFTGSTRLVDWIFRRPRSSVQIGGARAAVVAQHQQRTNAFTQTLHQSLNQPTGQGLTGLSSSAYHLEKLDPKHRMGDVLSPMLGVWQRSPSKAQGLGFFEWLDTLSQIEVTRYLTDLVSPGFARANAPAFMTGVQYLNRIARRYYKVIPDRRHSRLLYNGSPLTTKRAPFETVFSGRGWGAWVLSPTDSLYTGPHVRGQFHHSSFLSGAPVKAAGEWMCSGGRVEFITGKTGHYQCDIKALVGALVFLGSVTGLGGASVVVWKSATQADKVPAEQFVNDPSLQAQYMSFGRVQPVRQPVIGGHRR